MNWRLRVITFFLALYFNDGSNRLMAQTLSKDVQRRIDDAVQKEMENQQIVGVSVGIVRQGKVVYTKGYGWADREKRKPFTSKTITNWASNSKPVVAIRTMQLVEKGKLRLDDKIRKYVPELPEHCDPITLRDILCHQSGYPHYSNGRILRLATPIQSDQGYLDPVYSINRFGGSPLINNPGVAYSYSSYAFVILSGVLQRAGGKPLPDQITEGISGKLGMTSFGLDSNYDNQADWSIGYRKDNSGKVNRVPDQAHGWKHGAGGYKSNIIDFSKWAAALINQRLIKPKSSNELWTAQKLKSGKATNAGLGFFAAQQNGTLKVYHGGSHTEARSRLVMYPRQKHGIVVLCNCGHADPSRISTAIYRVLP